tara:strand:- start:1452 stop:2831 length:1380 start_codon:yes stop_codon:yes gene_type:complete
MKRLKFIVIFLILIGCNPNKKKITGIFVGGQIINPSSRDVTLYQGSRVIDMLDLNDNFKFQRKYDSLKNGIYKLEHLPEYQTVLLEEADSLWIRINATAFNESIVFSGIGATKNNFLIDLYLKQEEEVDFLSTKYSSNQVIFKKIIDSLVFEKKTSWIKMDSINNLSPIAQKVTQAAYIYPYASIRERYALLRSSKWTEVGDSLFFSYRKFLNYGDNDLAFFDPYVNYILNYISQKALKLGEPYFKAKETTSFNIRRLEILDKKISGKLLRNNLARAIAFEEMLKFKNQTEHDLFIQYYATVNSSKDYLREVIALHQDINKMNAGKPLPKVLLQNSERKTVNSASLAYGKPTVIYFWSQTQMNQYRNTLNRLNKLKNTYPNIRFIGICIQPFNALTDQVQKMMGLDSKDQFALTNFEKASKVWVLTLLNKGIVLNKKGFIVEGFGNFFDIEFEKILKNL